MKFSKFLLLVLIALPVVLTFVDEGRAFARAEDPTEEDEINADEDEAQVETGGEIEETEEEEGAGGEEAKTQGSPDVDVTILFTKPESTGQELPAGKLVEFLIGITNNGDREFVVDTADASFRYPMDFNFYIQNFSMAGYNKAVKPQQEATVMYSFFPSESFAGRPLGLQINLAYHDADGEDFIEAVFNSTITIVELDEGLDGETFFLYVFLMAFAVLLLLGGHQALTYLGVGGSKKGGGVSKKQQQQQSQVEVGTAKNGVDYDWLPEQFKADLKRKAAAAATANGSTKKAAPGKEAPPAKGPATKGPAAKGPAAKNARNAASTRSSPRLRKT